MTEKAVVTNVHGARSAEFPAPMARPTDIAERLDATRTVVQHVFGLDAHRHVRTE
jgi:hypothetical protein